MKRLKSDQINNNGRQSIPRSRPTRTTPEHVAIIMDGNGRWAESKNQPRSYGHQEGAKNLRPVTDAFIRNGVKHLTLFAFSTENWGRPDNEISNLIDILGEVLNTEILEIHRQGIRLQHIGHLDRLSNTFQQAIHDGIELTKDNNRLTLNIAFDYGGRDEIIHAIRNIMSENIPLSEVTEENFRDFLFTRKIPDPDLIIRTAGEMRLSNFLIWQSAYSEYYFSDTLWPDFSSEDIDNALLEYSRRKRRFGNLAPLVNFQKSKNSII